MTGSRTAHRILASLLLAAAVPTLALAARGGPDGRGYTWKDSDEPNLPMSAPNFPLNPLGGSGDDVVVAVPIPAFPFYGRPANTTAYVSSNGWISFMDPLGNSAPTPSNIPTDADPKSMIAWLWDDLTVPSQVFGGDNIAGDGYSFFFQPQSKATGAFGSVYVTLYNNGVIQIYYDSDPLLLTTGRTVVGTENEVTPFTTGLPYMSSGAALNGARPRAGYGVRFYPRGNLNCATGVTPIACNGGNVASDNNTGPSRVSTYNCSTGTYLGNEKVFSFTLARMSHLTIALSNTDGKNRSAFLVDGGCSEISGCIAGGSTLLTPRYVPAGTYYLVVDGATATDNGTFSITLSCQDAATLSACGARLTGQSTSGLDGITSWSCEPNSLNGPERLYEINVTGGPVTITSTLSNKSDPNLMTLVSNASTFVPLQASCMTSNATTANAWNAVNGTYYVAVDAMNGASGSYDLSIDCTRKLQCPAPVATLDPLNPAPVTGNTTGKPNNVETYYCTDSAYGTAGETTGFTGGEDIYQFTLTSPMTVAFLFDPSNPDLRLLILRNCYEGSCVMDGGCGENLQPGTYYLVVDGLNGASGAYSLTPFAVPNAPSNRWYDCPECAQGCGQTSSTLSAKTWEFYSNTFCGTGCDFSLYAVVECGTEFHIPLFDVETGHMRIFDVLQQQYLTINATNRNGSCPDPPSGTLVEWEDRYDPLTNPLGCTAIPCPGGTCGGGSYICTNVVLMDVWFRGNPNVCGIYRLDFINWGGVQWFAYANCTGERLEQYNLYRDVCSAMSNYRPRPEIGISDVTLDAVQNCAARRASGTFTVENIGCLPAAGFEVTIEQRLPPANPKTYTVDLLKGESKIYNWTYDFTLLPADLVFKVDPLNKTAECSESLGSVVSCGLNSALRRSWPVVTCPAVCATTAVPGADDQICEGAPYRLDGSGSNFLCVSGTPEYQWENGALPITGCTWSPVPTCDVPAPMLTPGLHFFTLRTRCKNDNPPCETSSSMTLNVVQNVVPAPLWNALRGFRDNDNARFSWAYAGTPISSLRVYKDADRRLPQATRFLLQQLGAFETTITDERAIVLAPIPIAYYQVVAVSCLGDLEGPY